MNRPDGLHLLSRIGDIDAARWDALLTASAATPPPALRHAYLATLEDTGCVAGRTGWTPAHATLWQRGELIGAMALYVKGHSYGEYVFDWAWAEAYQRHGLDYYPKWLSALPFTPIPGPRILGRDLHARRALLDAVLAQVRDSGASSFHVLFPAEDPCRPARRGPRSVPRQQRLRTGNADAPNRLITDSPRAPLFHTMERITIFPGVDTARGTRRGPCRCAPLR